jgi:hypothetical protein
LTGYIERPPSLIFDDEDSEEDDGTEHEGPDLLDTETEAREA